MAKTTASGPAQPWLAMLAKHHFWLLALAVPLVLLPVLFLARGTLTAQIEAVRAQIKGHITALQNVRRIPQHPNTSWTNDIDTSTMRVKRETLAEWRKFWDGQQSLRVWPDSLGPDFIKAVESLKPDGKLSPRLLERYQNTVRTLVSELPSRMGVQDAMVAQAEVGSPAAAQPQPVVQPAVQPELASHFATWDAGNQQRILSSFIWDRKPSTKKVLLAQEELWVYGVLCDVVARANKAATGPHNVAIARVDELFIGYLAAEDNPGGVNGGRVIRVGATAAGDGSTMPPPDAMASGAPGAPAGRPPNPRFVDGQRGVVAAPPGEEGSVPVDPDEQLRNWIYVDFTGKPLDAAQLATATDCQMVHLMPFVLRVVIDERQIDALLVTLATSSVPIDVRQVRFSQVTSAQASGQPSPNIVAPSGAGRLYDVSLELRGTVGLAAPPDEKTVGLEPGQSDEVPPAGAGEKPAAAPRAALLDRPTLRRIAS